jgi:hypothetical protein
MTCPLIFELRPSGNFICSNDNWKLRLTFRFSGAVELRDVTLENGAGELLGIDHSGLEGITLLRDFSRNFIDQLDQKNRVARNSDAVARLGRGPLLVLSTVGFCFDLASVVLIRRLVLIDRVLTVLSSVRRRRSAGMLESKGRRS